MQRKIIYFVNPISGTKNKARMLEAIKKQTVAQSILFEILHTNAAGDYSFLKEKIIAEKITDIVVCGGDGTVNQIAQSVLGAAVNIGIIPLGSGNGLAFAAKIPTDVNKALQIIFTGKPSFVDACLINQSFSCMLSGLGFDAVVAHDFAKQRRRGLMTYIKKSLQHFVQVPAYPFEVINKEKTFSIDAYFISVANGNQFGNNVTIAPKALLNDGLLDIVIVKKTNKIKTVLLVLQQTFSGKPNKYEEKIFRSNDIIYFQTDKLVINNPSLAPLHIDGEPAATAAQFIIEIIRNAFKLIQP